VFDPLQQVHPAKRALGGALLLVLLAAAPAPGEGPPDADPLAALQGAFVTELTMGEEFRKKARKDLSFAFEEGWGQVMLPILRKEMEKQALLAPSPAKEGAEAAESRVARPVRLHLVLTEASREAKDYRQLESRDTFVEVHVAARVELYLPGEDIPRSTDRVRDESEERTTEGLSSELFRDAFTRAFYGIAARASDSAARRLRPEWYEEEKKSNFVPFRRRRQ